MINSKLEIVGIKHRQSDDGRDWVTVYTVEAHVDGLFGQATAKYRVVQDFARTMLDTWKEHGAGYYTAMVELVEFTGKDGKATTTVQIVSAMPSEDRGSARRAAAQRPENKKES